MKIKYRKLILFSLMQYFQNCTQLAIYLHLLKNSSHFYMLYV